MTTAFDFPFVDLSGQPQALAQYRGKVLLLVNVASKCGFTPQYEGLEALWREFGPRGPGDAAQIGEFCSLTYGVSFPMSDKVEVNGDGADPLWQWLKAEKAGVLGTRGIKWNFSKFLVGRDGQVLGRYAPTDTPASLRGDIEAALG